VNQQDFSDDDQTEALTAAAVRAADGAKDTAPADTRRAAYQALDEQRLDTIRAKVRAFILQSGGSTDEEVSKGLGIREGTCRARRCELRDAGEVRDSGRRRQTASERDAVVWIVTTIAAASSSATADGEVLRPIGSEEFSEPIPALRPQTVGTGSDRCRCGRGGESVAISIHQGQSTRLDCRHCGRFVGWGSWYGKEPTSKQ